MKTNVYLATVFEIEEFTASNWVLYLVHILTETHIVMPYKWKLVWNITSSDVYFGQVGQGDTDHAYWGRPEDMTMYRPAWEIDTSAPGELHVGAKNGTIWNNLLQSDGGLDTFILH